MDRTEAQRLLSEAGQSHVLAFWDRLDDAARSRLLAQIASIDWAAVAELRGLLARPRAAEEPAPEPLEPAPVAELGGADRAAAAARGEAELRAGRVGALLVAGGQGTRLGFDGPKGCCPVGPVSGEPLFALHARKLLARKRRYGRTVPLYVMTSAGNDEATRAFFAERRFFGLDAEDVFFFPQAMWPALDPDGRVVLEAPDRVFLSPDGHGGVLAALARSGALADMEARGLSTVYFLQVDNPMADIAAPAAVGFHLAEGADATLLCCRRLGPEEKTGMSVLRGGRAAIVEYTEFSDAQRAEREPDGSLRFAWGSPALHVFSVPFLRREAAAGLPVHLAHKKVPFVDGTGATVKPAAPNAFKFEKFVFDALSSAQSVRCLAVDREEEYAPVKNREGEKSPAACRADLSRKWARWLRAAGVDVPLGADGRPLRRVEIDPAFADSPDALAARDLSGVEPAFDVCLGGAFSGEPGSAVFGLVADPHVADLDDAMGRRYRLAAGRLAEAARALRAAGARFLVEMGDLKDAGPDEASTLSYLAAAAGALRDFGGRVEPVLGNHDVDRIAKGRFLRGFADALGLPEPPAPHAAWREGAITFVRLDCDFFPDGRELDFGDRNHRACTVPPDQIAWLRDTLAAATGPCVVFCHSILTGDWDSVVTNGAEIRAALEAAGNVAAVFQAHTHADAFRTIAGIPYFTVPSICHGDGPYALAEVTPAGAVAVRGFRGAASRSFPPRLRELQVK